MPSDYLRTISPFLQIILCKPDKTIQLMAYAIEEIGISGSKEIAFEYKQNGKDVLGVLNFDMIGYNSDNV